MTDWPARVLMNTVYALLVEKAEAIDRAEVAVQPHVSDDARRDWVTHRDELDSWLAEPTGRQAEAEKALLRALGG